MLTAAIAVLLILLLSGAASAANKVESGGFGSNGRGAAQLLNAESIAINGGGTGGASAGDVYVADTNNSRIVQFTPAESSGSFVRTWGWDVVASGEHNAGADEQQTLTVKATGGKFSLSMTVASGAFGTFQAGSSVVTDFQPTLGTFHVGDTISGTPGGIPANTRVTAVGTGTLTLSASATQNIFNNNITAIANTGATGTGNLTEGSATVTGVVTRTGDFADGERISGTGLPVGTTIVSGGGTSTLTLSNPVEAGKSGTGVVLTANDIPYNASAAELKAALEALPGIGSGNLVVTGGPGDATGTSPYTITFSDGPLSGNDIAQIPNCTATTCVGLEGVKTVTVATPVAGGGFEICEADSSPVDVCKAGVSLGSAGALTNAELNIAVDQANGNVYVADTNNRRIAVYSAEGAFQGAFGWKVVKGSAVEDLQFCTTATDCQVGSTGAGGGQFAQRIGGIAVDPVSGHLLVANRRSGRVDEFGPTLNGSDEVTGISFARGFGWDVVASGPGDDTTAPEDEFEICVTGNGDVCKAGTAGPGAGQFSDTNSNSSGVATVEVDSNGAIYALDEPSSCSPTAICRIQRFDGATLSASDFAPAGLRFTSGSEKATQMALDDETDNLFVVKSTGSGLRVFEFDSAGVGNDDVSPPPSATGLASADDLAVRNANRVYVAQGSVQRVAILTPTPPPSVEIFPATDVTQTEATFHGRVTIPSPGGPGFETAYRFEYSVDGGFNWKRAPEPDAELGNGEAGGKSSSCPVPQALACTVSQTVTGLQPGANYMVRLVASTATTATSAPVTFATAQAPPAVFGTSPDPVGATSAKLSAFVNPNNRLTSYRFEWGKDTSYGNQIPVEFEPTLPAGGDPIKVTANLNGLQPNSTYHFRLVAASSAGTTNGPDREFTTLLPSGKPELPNNRAAELVSPADKGTAGSVADFGFLDQLRIQAAEDGEAFLYPIQNGIPESTAGGWTRWRAERTEEGWLSAQVSAPSLIPPPKTEIGIAAPSQVLFASPDLSCAVVQTYNPLTEDTSPLGVELGVINLYRWSADDGEYGLITSQVPLNPESLGENPPYSQIEAADDCSRIYFKSRYEFIAGGSGLYEWEEGAPPLRDAGELPDGTPGTGVVMGGETTEFATARWNAVSPDGARLFFSAISNEGPDSGQRAVFMRENGGATVIDVSQSQTAVPANGARFEAASAKGNRVFFRANYGIADDSSNGPTSGDCNAANGGVGGGEPTIEKIPCDLYVYDVAAEELTDLSPDTNVADAGIGAQVQGTVAIDEDGSHVYFATLGQLIPGEGRTYAENIAGHGSANIYLAHDGELSHVTTLAEQGPAPAEGTVGLRTGDLFGPTNTAGAALMRMTNSWVAQTSDNGNELLFVSSRNLTGYDPGGIDKYAAYQYSVETDEIECISCRPDGLPSEALSRRPTPDGKGVEFAQSSWLLASSVTPGPSRAVHRPRSMSEGGSRVFFTSPDVLAPGATPGKRNVYQWEEGEVRFLATAERSGGNGFGEYLGASASGDDVFIATREQLAPQDVDFVSDVYDLKVDGGFPPEVEPVRCNPAADECQGEPGPQPPGFIPPSGDSSDGDVIEPSPATCGRQEVRRDGRCVAKRKIAERQCRKQTGALRRRCVRARMRKLNRPTDTDWRAAK